MGLVAGDLRLGGEQQLVGVVLLILRRLSSLIYAAVGVHSLGTHPEAQYIHGPLTGSHLYCTNRLSRTFF